MDLDCRTDTRRDTVRSVTGRNGLDYVEVDDDGVTLRAYFLGKLPPEFADDGPQLVRHLAVDGGDVVRGLAVLDVDPHVEADPEDDDFLVIRLDRAGDFSAYSLRLVDVAGVDPRYDRAEFRFHLCCPDELDCKPACGCGPAVDEAPALDYLAKDYASFRRLIYDRLALQVPQWTERHVPDLGVTLVELLAYAGDYLSYCQDAVATEAYLDTARQRISVRRHARLVDYRLHEGCNARAWVQVAVSQDLAGVPSLQVGFITALNDAFGLLPNVLDSARLAELPHGGYEYYEPADAAAGRVLSWYAAHNEMRFHTWGGRECCLRRGATGATLLDAWIPADGDADTPQRSLRLAAGDVLVFEEVLGAKTGMPGDANPAQRWAVRLTRADPIVDDLVADGAAPIPLVAIEWAAADALPFDLCLSSLRTVAPAATVPPDCSYLDGVSVARGNIVLVDHGRRVAETLPAVPQTAEAACCDCVAEPADVLQRAGRYRPALSGVPLTWRGALPGADEAASRSLEQDPREALPVLALTDSNGDAWTPRLDLLASGAGDRHVVVETDNDGIARLRYGDGDLGCSPPALATFEAGYRVGNGRAGNVGAESIGKLVLHGARLDGVVVTVRNPLPARGGVDAEPIAEAKLLAPGAFRQRIERAVTASDYAQIAQRDARLQRASAQLVWTGSWYEADIALDPRGSESASESLLAATERRLRRYRRMGHDLHLRPARYVPILLHLHVCVLPGYARAQVLGALRTRFGNAAGGWFHADALTFGEAIHISRLVAAAQAVAGVECATVKALRRLGARANQELQNGVLPLAAYEIAQLDNDPNHPERGQLVIHAAGGR